MDNLCCLWFALERGMRRESCAKGGDTSLLMLSELPAGPEGLPHTPPLCSTPPPHRWTTLLQHCLLNAPLLSISCQMQYYHSHIPTKMAIQLNRSFSAVAENSVFAREQTHHVWVEYCFMYCSRYWIEEKLRNVVRVNTFFKKLHMLLLYNFWSSVSRNSPEKSKSSS